MTYKNKILVVLPIAMLAALIPPSLALGAPTPGKGCFGLDIPCIYLVAVAVVFGLMIFGLSGANR